MVKLLSEIFEYLVNFNMSEIEKIIACCENLKLTVNMKNRSLGKSAELAKIDRILKYFKLNSVFNSMFQCSKILL